jgi:hypothetical protein
MMGSKWAERFFFIYYFFLFLFPPKSGEYRRGKRGEERNEPDRTGQDRVGIRIET